MNCKSCVHAVDYGESVEYIKCERKRKVDVKKSFSCSSYKECEHKAVNVCGNCKYFANEDSDGIGWCEKDECLLQCDMTCEHYQNRKSN